ncbi:3-dehydroquinate dehydratase [archaeon]|nr:3-dehydroquinate dehydratase [archaeon]
MKLISKIPAVCASIIEYNIEDFLRSVRQVEGADFIEIRADGLKVNSPKEYLSETKRLLNNVKAHSELPVLLTVRTEKDGGVFRGSESERARVLMESMKLVDSIDIELRMQSDMQDEIVKEARKNRVDIIISYHDFNSTPEVETLLSILEKEESEGATIAKVAVKANSEKDVLVLLNILQAAKERISIPVIGISLGRKGRISRVAAPLLGSIATYGYVNRKTAPGQIEVKKLKEIIELMELMK